MVWTHAWFEVGCRDVRPAAHLLFLRRQEKKAKEGDPTVCVPCASLRGNLRCSRPAGSRSYSLRCASLRHSRALIRWPRRSSAPTEGMGEPNSQTATRAIASLGPNSSAHVPRAGRSSGRVERSDDPNGCLGVHPLPAAPAAGRLWGGMGVEAPMLRHLTRRSCPNGAAKQHSEFCGAPRNRPAAGLPRSAAQGSQTGGRLLLPSFLGDARKEGAPPGAYPGTRPQTRHASKPAHKPRIRQAQPERTVARQDAIISVASSGYPISARAQKHLKPQRPTP